MIVVETKTINGREFTYTYSDAGFMIERDGVKYAEAYDPSYTGRVYTETDKLIPVPEGESTMAAEMADMKAALEVMGVTDDE